MNGPFELEMKIHLTDGERCAVVTYSLPVGKTPTQAMLSEAFDKALASVHEQVGQGWRLQTREEFTNTVLAERYNGMAPHVATETEWDA